MSAGGILDDGAARRHREELSQAAAASDASTSSGERALDETTAPSAQRVREYAQAHGDSFAAGASAHQPGQSPPPPLERHQVVRENPLVEALTTRPPATAATPMPTAQQSPGRPGSVVAMRRKPTLSLAGFSGAPAAAEPGGPKNLNLSSHRPLSPRAAALCEELRARNSALCELIPRICMAFDQVQEYDRTAREKPLDYQDHSSAQTGISYIGSSQMGPIVRWNVRLGGGMNKNVWMGVDCAARELLAVGMPSSAPVSWNASAMDGAGFSTQDKEPMGPELLRGLSRHPNVVFCRVLSDGRQKPSSIMVMPLVKGGDLAAFLRKLEPAKQIEDARMMISLFEGAARGLDYLASQGFVHGDVKLENCLVHLDPSLSPTAQVADLDGLRLLQHYKSRVVMEGRTLSRISPQAELCVDDALPTHPALAEYDWRKEDVWSFGLMLFEKLTGGLPPLAKDRRAQLAYDGRAQELWQKEIAATLEQALASWPVLGPARGLLIQACCEALNPRPDRASMGAILSLLAAAKESLR